MAYQNGFRQRCPWADVYDARHIRLKGYNCPYKHRAYDWPSATKGSTLISDSIPKFVNRCHELHVQAMPGLRFEQMLFKIKLGQLSVKNSKLVILHCGTNNFLSSSNDDILSLIERNISAVRVHNPTCIIAKSAIIQRSCDNTALSKRLQELNCLINICAVRRIASFCASTAPYWGAKKMLRH